jgi:hypothetical protein
MRMATMDQYFCNGYSRAVAEIFRSTMTKVNPHGDCNGIGAEAINAFASMLRIAL